MNKPQQNSLSRWLAFFLYSYSRCQDTCNASGKGEKSPSGSCLRGEICDVESRKEGKENQCGSWFFFLIFLAVYSGS